MSSLKMQGSQRVSRLVLMAAGVVAMAAASASADTRIMPTRQALVGTPIVVWGNTTQANGTAYTLDCGNGTTFSGNLGGANPERSYIFMSCTYGSANSFTATLTVGAESASTTVAVVDGSVMSPAVRAAKINMAIEDGLRFLYSSQFNRAATFDSNMTAWNGATTASNPNAFTALAVLALENHGHPFNGTDIYAPVVQRGLNYLFDKLGQIDMSQPAASVDSVCGKANDPCANIPAPTNIGLAATDGNNGYATPIYAAAIAAAVNAGGATLVGPGIGSNNANFVAGRSYAEILQRIVQADAWGQSNNAGNGFGGWYYSLRCGNCSDGSTTGWQMLGLFDSQAAGAVIPAFVKTRFNNLLTTQMNTNGTWDYQANGFAGSAGDMTKVGISLQAMAFLGVTAPDARITATENYITRNWTNQVDGPEWSCGSGTPSANNKGCGYAMFNNFKGLKAYGVATLPGIGRPAGGSTGLDGTVADDWYADYVDNLLANQHNPTSPTDGSWTGGSAPIMQFSGYSGVTATGSTALAELILSPVAFVNPDPILFSTVGLSPISAVNPIGTDHTVTAFAQSSNNQPVLGATMTFKVLTGPNANATGTCVPASCVTGADGKVNFTYHDNGGAGTDTIQAFIGTLGSNQVTKTWANAVLKCDADGDGKVTQADLLIIRAANGQVASGPNDPRDGNSDGAINVADVRYCQLRLTN